MAQDTDNRSLVIRVVGAYLFLSGLYHLLDGSLMIVGGLGGVTLNVLFATLSLVLGLGLVFSAGGLFLFGSGGWYLGAGLLTLFTVMLDMMSVLLRENPAAGLDALFLLVGLVVIVRRQSSDRSRADMDEEDSVHDIGRDYP